MVKKITVAQARKAFEEMHKGRNLHRHSLRGTYTSQAISALWNQHLKTLRWLKLLIEDVKPLTRNETYQISFGKLCPKCRSRDITCVGNNPDGRAMNHAYNCNNPNCKEKWEGF
jgi:hypothetical protein